MEHKEMKEVDMMERTGGSARELGTVLGDILVVVINTTRIAVKRSVLRGGARCKASACSSPGRCPCRAV